MQMLYEFDLITSCTLAYVHSIFNPVLLISVSYAD
jgi:hypothetical protein